VGYIYIVISAEKKAHAFMFPVLVYKFFLMLDTFNETLLLPEASLVLSF